MYSRIFLNLAIVFLLISPIVISKSPDQMTENSFSGRLRNLAMPTSNDKWAQFVKDMFRETNVLRQTPDVIKKYFETMLSTIKGNCVTYPGNSYCMNTKEGAAG